MAVVGIVARIVIGIVLLVAGGAKLRTSAWGVLAMEAGTPRPVVVTLPTLEVLLGAAVALQLFTNWLPWLVVALFVAFTAVVIQRYWSGSRAGCNCFGTKKSQEPVDRFTIARNMILVLIAVVGALR